MYKARIFLVDRDGEALTELEETGYVREAVLQGLLARYPDLLPGDQIDPENPRRWLLVGRELGVPATAAGGDWWSLDHLFLDQDGIPTFVECKRATDTRIRRELVAQMLDYAANATEYWSLDRLRQAAAETARANGKSLDDVVADLIGEGSEEEIEEYWERVEVNLRNRRLRLVFVADSIPKELRRLVEFLNEEMINVEVLAVEVKQYQGKGDLGQRALVPRVIGLTEMARSAKGVPPASRRRWSEEDFFQALAENVSSDAVRVVRDLYEWGKTAADRITFGAGRQVGSFTFCYLRGGETLSVFTVYTNGRLALSYGSLRSRVDQRVLEGFHKRISEIPTFEHIPADFSKWPSVRVEEVLADPRYVAQFKQAVQWLGEGAASDEQ